MPCSGKVLPALGKLKPGSHYQSSCSHSRNFAWVNSKFWRICKKCLMELTSCLTLSPFLQTFLANPSKRRMYPWNIPIVLQSQKLW
jgi:hypothetical protein